MADLFDFVQIVKCLQQVLQIFYNFGLWDSFTSANDCSKLCCQRSLSGLNEQIVFVDRRQGSVKRQNVRVVEPLMNVNLVLELLVQVVSLNSVFLHFLHHQQKVQWLKLGIVPAAEPTDTN